MNMFGRNLALWVIIGLLVVALFNLFQGPSMRGSAQALAYSDFLNDVSNGQITDVIVTNSSNTVTGHFRDGRSVTT